MSEAENDSDYTIDLLLRFLDKEIQQSTLSQIPSDFYQNVATVIHKLKSESKSDIEKLIQDEYIVLLTKCVTSIFELRFKKIQNNMKNADIYPHLTSEEKVLIDGLDMQKNNKKEIVTSIVSGYYSLLEIITNNFVQKPTIVRFVTSMEPFIGIDLNRYGPFEKEDVSVIPFDNARSLVSTNHAEIISSHILK